MLFAAMAFFMAIPALAQDPGWIGIQIEDQNDRGAIVRRVEPNSPAEKAGIKEGDVVLEFNKEPVIGVQQLTRLIRETPSGRTVDMKVHRDNRDENVKVTTERASNFTTVGPFGFEMHLPDVRVNVDRIRDLSRVQVNTTYVQSGIRVEQMTDQLRDFFGVFSNGGILVTSVDSGSAADKAGLKAGDVITAVDGRMIRTPGDFSREMRSGGKPTLKVIREKKERDIKFE